MFARSALLSLVLLAVNVAAVPAYYGDNEVAYTSDYVPAYTTSAYEPAYTTSSAYEPEYTPAYTSSNVCLVFYLQWFRI